MQKWVTWHDRATTVVITHSLLPPEEKWSQGPGDVHKVINTCWVRIFPVKTFGQSNKILAWPDKATHRQEHADWKLGAGAQEKEPILLSLLLQDVGAACPLTCDRNSLLPRILSAIFSERPSCPCLVRLRPSRSHFSAPQAFVINLQLPSGISKIHLPTSPVTFRGPQTYQPNGLVALAAH